MNLLKLFALLALALTQVSAFAPSSCRPTQIVSPIFAASFESHHQSNSNNKLLNFSRPKLSFKTQVNVWRAVFGGGLATILLNRSAIDVQLAHFWTFLTTSPHWMARIFRTDSYEWCLAVACFGIYIHLFGYADRLVRKADAKGEVHSLKKYRLQDRYAKATGTNVAVQQSPWNYKAWTGEFMVYVLPLLAWDILAPRRHRRIGGFAAPTTMQIIGGVTAGLVMYDALFFIGHYLMHKIPFLYKTVHVKHHKVKEVRAAEIVRLSIAEEVLEVGFSIIALNLLSVHPLARSLYNIIITFLLTELHCGFDFSWTPQNVIPFGLATGSRRHHYHHRFGKHYYQKFFYTLDRWFGHYQRDDGTVMGDSVKAVNV